jgi:hypothetical protein
LIGATIGSIIGGVLLSFGIFFLYKWNKKRKNPNFLPTPGTYNNYNQDERNIHNHGQERFEPVKI